MKRNGFLLALMPLALAGCGELFGQTVTQPGAVVTNLLFNMPQAADLMDIPTLFPNVRKVAERKDGNVVWTYWLLGKEACRFTAHIKPSGDSMTTVWTEIEDISGGDKGFLCSAVDIAGSESVSATLDGRAADRSKVESQLASATVGNLASLQKGLFETINAEADNRDYCRGNMTTADQRACEDGTWSRNNGRR
jgi:hypothetical protein